MPSPCTWFPTKVFEPRRYRPRNAGAWTGHLPFAHDLIAALRPTCFVELGTHLGESYFGFCQTIVENQIACTAYAVDTWMGEQHAGFYDNSVYEEVQAYNDANYGNFSYLLRSLFNDALPGFADESIDLVHLDGMHTIEAVSGDFYSWLPKVKPGGIVLLHDICARHLDFGVWKLWERLETEAETFAFHHSWGLGVFRKPGGAPLESEFLKALFEGSQMVQEQIRRHYTLAAIELDWKHRIETGLRERLPHLQIYSPCNGSYEEDRSEKALLEPDQWQCISIDVPQGVFTGQLRLDPTDSPGIIDIRGITLLSAVDHTPLWSSSSAELSQLTLGGTLMPLPSLNSNGACRFFSYGNDPQIYLPSLEAGRLDQPLTLRVWLRWYTDLEALKPLLAPPPSSDVAPATLVEPEILASLQTRVGSLSQELEQEKLTAAQAVAELTATQQALASGQQELSASRGDLEASQRDREQLTDEINKKQTKLYLLEEFRQELKQENEELRDRYVALEKTYVELRDAFTSLETEHATLQTSHQELQQKHQAVDATLTGVLHSRSWRITGGLRKIAELIASR